MTNTSSEGLITFEELQAVLARMGIGRSDRMVRTLMPALRAEPACYRPNRLTGTGREALYWPIVAWSIASTYGQPGRVVLGDLRPIMDRYIEYAERAITRALPDRDSRVRRLAHYLYATSPHGMPPHRLRELLHGDESLLEVSDIGAIGMLDVLSEYARIRYEAEMPLPLVPQPEYEELMADVLADIRYDERKFAGMMIGKLFEHGIADVQWGEDGALY